jgi:hypothetical protein
MIAAGRFTDWWVYLTAPLVGGTVAATLYERLLRSEWAPNRLGKTPSSGRGNPND